MSQFFLILSPFGALCLLAPNLTVLKMKPSLGLFTPDSQESSHVPFPGGGGVARQAWTSAVVLPSFHSPPLSSRDHSFATPRLRGLGKVDTIPSIQGPSQGIPSTGMNDLWTGTDQSQPHQSQSLNLSCNYGEREAVFWPRWVNMGPPRACLRMMGTERKAELIGSSTCC